MILLNNYYIDKNPERRKEIEVCLMKNLKNPHISHILLFAENGIDIPDNPKIIPVRCGERPTYADYFEYGSYFSGVKILANSDIYFNDTLSLCKNIGEKEVYALCRWNDTGRGAMKFYNKKNSQDVWIWKGMKYVDANFGLGRPGCDGSIAYLLKIAGYEVLNPSQSIQTIHLHNSNIRHYTFEDDLVPGPYMYIDPSTIYINKGNHQIINFQHKPAMLPGNYSLTDDFNHIDVVYVLGKGSRWKNNEIRFSLRSIEKNLTGYRNIYVIGENPGFLKNVIHVQHPDELGPHNADGNIARKVMRACQIPELSENFLFINDDHIIVHPVDARKIPAFHKGDMATYPPSHWNNNHWRKRLRRTFDMLKAKGFTTFNFDCHTPIIFNKEIYRYTIEKFNYSEDIGYTMKSLYGNVVHQDTGVMLSTEKKTIFQNFRIDQIESRLRNCFFMSFNDEGLNAHLKKWLWMRFPEKSKFEINDVEDFYVELLQWMAGERDYKDGTNLFAKYIRRSNINKLFNAGETPALKEKLEFKFKIIIQDYER